MHADASTHPLPIRLDLGNRVFELTTAEIEARSDHLRIARRYSEATAVPLGDIASRLDRSV